MTIKQNLVPASKYALKCPNPMTPIGICVHNTANDASAKGEISYMVGNALQTSFHFAVDDLEAWQGLPLDRNGWHAGDGANGAGNRKHIGLEICYSKSGGQKFATAENNAAELIAQLLKERNWGVEKVKKHQDFSGKYCPHRTLDLGWTRFLDVVKSKMGTAPTPVPGTMTDAELRQKLVEELNKNKDILDFGEDKHKLNELMNDPPMLARIFASMGRAKAERVAKITTLQSDNQILQDRIDELENQTPPVIADLPKEIDCAGSKWEINGVEFDGYTKLGNYKKKE